MRQSGEFGIWNGMVEYSHAVMETVRQQAVNGFNSFSHGGLEIGGVLYGERHDETVRILASQELECEHANGPGFVLSENDSVRFRELMKPRGGMRVVGWYTSHTRSTVTMNSNDCAIMERLFGDRGSVALIVKPARFGPVEATFYLQGYAEPGPHFSVLPPPRGERPQVTPAAPLQPEPQPAIEAAEAPVLEMPPPVAPTVRKRDLRRPVGIAAGIGFAVVMTGLLLQHQPTPNAASAAVRVGLQGYLMADRQIRIEWDRQSAAFSASPTGTLEIRDGSAHYTFPLTAQQLRTSSMTYARQTDAIEVRLKLSTGVEEAVQVLAPSRPSPLQPPANTVPAVVSRAAFDKPVPPIIQNVTPVPSEDRDRDLENVPSAAAPRPQLKEFSIVEERRAPIVLSEPPPVSAPIRVPASAALAKLPLTGAPPPLAKPQRSGRIIWTGSLGRRGVVELEGARATIGSISGALPGSAAKLAVYPAEFKRDRLVVYVSDAGRNGRSEAPGPMTGWNRLEFEWDPERAHQITVVEAPTAGNQFARLALRNEARACSVIVVEWRVD